MPNPNYHIAMNGWIMHFENQIHYTSISLPFAILFIFDTFATDLRQQVLAALV